MTFWGWHVYQDDPEHELGTALDRFSEAKWKVESIKWVNPHSWPNECYFTDRSIGVTVKFHRARNGWRERFTESLKVSSLPAAKQLLAHLTDPALSAATHFARAEERLTATLLSLRLEEGRKKAFQRLIDIRAKAFQAEISQNPQGQILEPGFRVIFPLPAPQG